MKPCEWRGNPDNHDKHVTNQAFVNGFVLALQTIRSHKLRAFLTVLGVIIGTGTIIGVGAIMTGFDTSITAVRAASDPIRSSCSSFPWVRERIV